jgi:hypothetical protein
LNLWPLLCQSAGEPVEEAILGLRPGTFGAVWLLLTALPRRIIVAARPAVLRLPGRLRHQSGPRPSHRPADGPGPGSAWTAGIGGLLIDTAPPDLRNRALALAGARMMFTQGAGFALWGIAGQYLTIFNCEGY